VGGIRDTVVDGVTGLLVPPRRPGSLALALRELLADRTARESYGIAGRDRVMARYSWDRIATATEAVYRDVLAGRHRSVDRSLDHSVGHGVDHEPDMAGAAADGGER
jgi:glycogen synthase